MVHSFDPPSLYTDDHLVSRAVEQQNRRTGALVKSKEIEDCQHYAFGSNISILTNIYGNILFQIGKGQSIPVVILPLLYFVSFIFICLPERGNYQQKTWISLNKTKIFREKNGGGPLFENNILNKLEFRIII